MKRIAPPVRPGALDFGPAAAQIKPVGAVAQLGERVVRNDEVVGSIPIGSTKHPINVQ